METGGTASTSPIMQAAPMTLNHPLPVDKSKLPKFKSGPPAA